jgi:predicted metal-dependent HD superfamily phosphohydrolase
MVRVDLLGAWPLPTGTDLRDDLLAAYAHPSRGYHDTRHLTEVLERLDELARSGVAFDRLSVGLAAWFHDGVYDGERDAEERSAAWAEAALPALVEPAVVAEVARLVRLTETHRPEPDDLAGGALSDADLAILASGPERYEEYVATVRVDYVHVPEDLFVTGRAAVLRDLLSPPHLFHTAYARSAWEAPARANVEAELARLDP